MAKEPENDLAQLFAAALEDETREGRPPTKSRPAPSVSAPSKTQPPLRGKRPSVDETAETVGLDPRPSVPSRLPERAPIPAPSTRPTARAQVSSTPSGSASSASKPRDFAATGPAKTIGNASLPPSSGALSRASMPASARPGPAGAVPSARQGLSPTPKSSTPPRPSPSRESDGITPLAKRGGPSLAPLSPVPSLLESRPSMGPNSKVMASGIRGRPASELSADSASDLVDHKGRSKPIFAPRSPRPQSKKLHPAVDLIAGLFPGARWMANERVPTGLAYAIVGLFTLLPGITVLVGWTTRASAVERLMITRGWLAAHAAVLVVSLLLFELVRSGAALDQPRRHLRWARWIAALTLPAALVVLGAPTMMGDAPSLLEPVWFAALPLAVAGIVATVDVLARGIEPDHGHRAALVTATTIAAGFLAGALVLAVSMELRVSLEKQAAQAGFVRLPGLIRALRIS